MTRENTTDQLSESSTGYTTRPGVVTFICITSFIFLTLYIRRSLGKYTPMCGRYTHRMTWQQIHELDWITNEQSAQNVAASYNVAPRNRSGPYAWKTAKVAGDFNIIRSHSSLGYKSLPEEAIQHYRVDLPDAFDECETNQRFRLAGSSVN